ncbi:MAG TPA: transcription antitermination factor NusB [Actinomycetota bacterium]|nr:transcription antitermination factor NusB [Actinomycetota bacterium]
MASRTKARRLAIDVLYQSDVTGSDGRSVIAEWERAGREVPAFTRELVEGVADALDDLDRVIGAHSEGWRVDRMASLDRTILRVATFELRVLGTPVGAAIDEAVKAAKDLSTEDSGRFVNGVLGRIAEGPDAGEG